MGGIKAGDRVHCLGKGEQVFHVVSVATDHAHVAGLGKCVRLHKLTKAKGPAWAFKVVDGRGNVIDWFEDRLTAERYMNYWNMWEANPKRLSVQAV